MNNLKLTTKDLDAYWIKGQYQTVPDSKRVATFLREWNDIVTHFSDPQDLFLELNRYSYNRFLMGHSFVDGNKRMHRFLTDLINNTIKIENIL